MIVLWLLVAHLVGDYLLQTRWQANGKFGWETDAMWLRMRHVGGYVAVFVPVAFAYSGRDVPQAFAFLALLATAHYLTDAQRFTRTPGEWLLHRARLVRAETLRVENTRPYPHPMMSHVTFSPLASKDLPLPPNPWLSLPLAIDQTLHLIQIAVLAQVFLR